MEFPRNAVEAVTHADPFPYYRRLREETPLFFDETLNLWVATGHAVVAEAFAHPQLRVRPPVEPVPQALLGTAAGEVFAQLVRMTDGAFHAAHKPAVEQAARRWTLPDVAHAAREAAADLQPRTGTNDFLALLPVQAMTRLLGVPRDLLDATCAWVRDFARGIAPGASAQDVALAATAAQALMEQGRAQGLESARAANRIAFMQQALDATWALGGLTVLAAREHAGLAAAACASPEAMRAFVAEVERHQAPTQNTRRWAAQPLELAGQTIAQGQGVLLVMAAANRDPALNPNPDAFDPGRANRRSMGFGHAAHACPGAAIAIEIAAASPLWMRAAGRFASWRPLGNIRSPLFEH